CGGAVVEHDGGERDLVAGGGLDQGELERALEQRALEQASLQREEPVALALLRNPGSEAGPRGGAQMEVEERMVGVDERRAWRGRGREQEAGGSEVVVGLEPAREGEAAVGIDVDRELEPPRTADRPLQDARMRS